MSNLIPERRTDKNGVTSTRWVRAANGQKKKSLPSPALPPLTSDQNEVVKRVMKQFLTLDLSKGLDPTAIQNKLSKLPRATIDYLNTPDKFYGENDYLDKIVISALHSESSPVLVDDLAYLFKNMNVNIVDYDRWGNRGFEGEMIIGDVLRGVHAENIEGLTYDFDSDIPLRLKGDDSGKKIVALLNVVNVLMDEFDYPNLVTHDDVSNTDVITDRSFTQYVIDKHDRNEELLDIMMTRKTNDLKVIAAIMDADATAMRDGVL